MIVPDFEGFASNKALFASIEQNLQDLKKHFEILKGLVSKPANQTNFDSAINAFYWLFDCIPLIGPYIDSYDMPLFRAWANDKKNVLFSKISEISYNSTYPQGIGEGRFNQMQEAVFYASLPVDNDIVKSSLAACLETCKGLTALQHPVTLKDFTIGRWKILKPFYVINFCFDEEHLKGNAPLKKQVDQYFKAIRECLNKESSDFITEFLIYFSVLTGKRSEQKSEYYLLIAMFNAIQIYYKKNGGTVIKGLIYPSAMTEKKGLNIVLTTAAVDEYLRLDKVGMYWFFLDGKTFHGDPCCDAVDIKGDGFTITGFSSIPENRWYTIECESKTGGPLRQSRD